MIELPSACGSAGTLMGAIAMTAVPPVDVAACQ